MAEQPLDTEVDTVPPTLIRTKATVEQDMGNIGVIESNLKLGFCT